MVGSVVKVESTEFLALFDVKREKVSCQNDCESLGINKSF